jgi:hypothetical protein
MLSRCLSSALSARRSNSGDTGPPVWSARSLAARQIGEAEARVANESLRKKRREKSKTLSSHLGKDQLEPTLQTDS